MKPVVDLAKNAEDRTGGIDAVLEDDSKSDIKDDTNDIKHDSNDIIIETGDQIDRINVPIILRLKPSTINKMDDIAYKTRRSRNYVAQQLLDQAMNNVKLK